MGIVRDNSLDKIGGVLILYMILGHTVSLTSKISPSPIVDTFYRYCSALFFFYMPWFFYKAGMFFREEDTKAVIAKSKKRLLKPWLIWSAVAVIVGALIAIIHQDLQGFIIGNGMGLLFAGAVSDNAPLWFLISLFVVRVVFAWLKKRSINTWMIIFGSLTLSYALSFIPAFKPYYLANIFLGLFFFSIGNKLQKTPAVSDNDYLVLLIIPIALLYLIRTSFVDFRTNTLMEGNYLIYCLMSLLAILGWNKLFKKLEYSKLRGGVLLQHRSQFFILLLYTLDNIANLGRSV